MQNQGTLNCTSKGKETIMTFQNSSSTSKCSLPDLIRYFTSMSCEETFTFSDMQLKTLFVFTQTDITRDGVGRIQHSRL